MDFTLDQRGRASLAFVASLAKVSSKLKSQVQAELDAAGLDQQGLAADLDERLVQVDKALEKSRAFRSFSLLVDWASFNHGRLAIDAFESVRPALEPRLKALQQGPTQIEQRLDAVPAYFDGVEFHRTTGGWDGHEYQGFIHSELVHRHYVALTYPGDIYAQRRQVLAELPRQDFKRIFEMGTSTGQYTRGLQQTYPDAQITGCDLSLRALEQAQRVANENGWTWRLLRVPAEDTGLPSGSFDLVTSYILLHEIPGDIVKKCFAEAFRLLEPGGWMLMSDVTAFQVMDRRTEWWVNWEAINGGEPHWRSSASLDLAQVARDVGFVDVKSYGLGERRYPWVTLGRKPE